MLPSSHSAVRNNVHTSATKLRRTAGHARKAKLKGALTNAGISDRMNALLNIPRPRNSVA